MVDRGGLRTFARFLIVAFFVQMPSRQSEAQVTADVIGKAERSVVRIEIEGRKGEGLGSGFIVDESGVLITNSHVIAGASRAIAVFSDGVVKPIVGTRLIDPARDIAIAKIDGSGFVPLSLAGSNPRKGESVTALGAPMGLSFTATRGSKSTQPCRRETAADHSLMIAEMLLR
jgi:S1-C subfamily serine protease